MLPCTAGSHDFHPFQAFADMVNNARSLRKLTLGIGGELSSRDSLGLLNTLARAAREHTGLQGLMIDWSRTMEGMCIVMKIYNE
jgi:hypothetical protein